MSNPRCMHATRLWQTTNITTWEQSMPSPTFPGTPCTTLLSSSTLLAPCTVKDAPGSHHTNRPQGPTHDSLSRAEVAKQATAGRQWQAVYTAPDKASREACERPFRKDVLRLNLADGLSYVTERSHCVVIVERRSQKYGGIQLHQSFKLKLRSQIAEHYGDHKSAITQLHESALNVAREDPR